MIKKLTIKNFRSLCDVQINFEEDITVLVGENDSGKSSIIDVFKIMFENSEPELDDFYSNADNIELEVEKEDKSFIKEFKKNKDGNIESNTMVRINKQVLDSIKEELDSESFNLLEDKRERLESYATLIGVQFKSNIGTDNLKERVSSRVDEIFATGEFTFETSVPNHNIYFLDGKDFETIDSFLQKIFFKEIKRDAWNEKTSDGRTVKEVINDHLNSYSENLTTEIEEKGIKKNLKKFLPSLTEISIKSNFEPRDLNINVKAHLLEENGEINIEKKGDGTKRRITMALLDYKKTTEEKEPSVYIFDEPDTHLHVRAQTDLLYIMKSFNESGKQVIIATHSPFIMNSVHPRQLRFLELENGTTNVKFVSRDKDIEWTLKSLGIENIHLFFSKRVLIVEGETEEKFIPLTFEKIYGKSLYSNLVRVINRKSITDVPRFAEVISKFVKPEDIFIFIDNDADEETEHLIEELSIPNQNIFKVGHKEFEDSFNSEVIYEAWKSFVERKDRKLGDSWTIENIEGLKKECTENSKKFSKELRELNSGCSLPMKKTVFAQALAEYCETSNLDNNITDLFEKIHSP
ncbi:MAG: AAA family ATPase [Archaeoglobaceae archaeon]